MKISAEGYFRNCGVHVLKQNDLSGVEEQESCYRDGIQRDGESGDLSIVTVAHNVRLDGSYRMILRLTKREIANLARIALSSESFGGAVEALSKKSITRHRRRSRALSA